MSGDGAAGHERILDAKEDVARRLYEHRRQCSVLRFEERARECIRMARLRSTRPEPKGNRQVRSSQECGTAYKKCAESSGYDPKPSDLGVGRLKRDESCVEDR